MNTHIPLIAKLALCCVMCSFMFAGCNSTDNPQPTTSSQTDSRAAMNAAIKQKDWANAWAVADAVLSEHPRDPELMVTVARVAFETGHQDRAADLMAAANLAEEFSNPQHVQLGMVAMAGSGRLFEMMAMLEEAVKKHPLQHHTRRWLFDSLIETENRLAAIPHGQFLVQHRQFDVALLLSLSSTRSPIQDNDSLDAMRKQTQSDSRKMISLAKAEFDLGLLSDSIATLRKIIAQYPNELPPQMLLGRALISMQQFDDLAVWNAELQGDYKSSPGYWLTMGDWARSKQQNAQAARAYWESAVLDPDAPETWTSLVGCLIPLQSEQTRLYDEAIEAAGRRISLLNRFQLLREQFVKSGSKSRQIVADIAETLVGLGRLWEAEAWTAVALTLPTEPVVSIEDIRKSIVQQMHKDMPWQLLIGHSELQLNLSALPFPSFDGIASIQDATTKHDVHPPGSEAKISATSTISLADESKARELVFFGRTGDKLNQPGIQTFQILGCGGGAIDFDLDGWLDLYLMAAGGTPPMRDSASNRMFRNTAGSFIDVTSRTTTDDAGFGQGVAVGDVNEDGFPDLLLLNYGPNCLFVNNGDGTFTDRSHSTLPSRSASWSTSGAIADINNDSLSDIIIVNYCAGLEPVTLKCFDDENANEARSCVPTAFNAQQDEFLEGSFDGVFVDRTAAWNAIPGISGRGLGVIVGALDSQPGTDIYVANDMSGNHYWSCSNVLPFKLVESAMLRGLSGDARSQAQGSMGIAVGDFDRDLDFDLYVTNFIQEYNTLYEHKGSGIFQDQTSVRGLASPTLPMVGFGTAAIDLENDGELELIVANGHVDVFDSGKNRSQYAQPMQVFRRTEDGTYAEIRESIQGEYLRSKHVGRALFTCDIDRNGLVDMLVTHQTEPVALLMNATATSNHFFEVRLVGTDCSRDAIGAIVELTAGEQTWLSPLTAGGGFECSPERVIRFGLGACTDDATVKIRWADDSVDTFARLAVDTQWLLTQNGVAFELPLPTGF